MKYFHIIQEAEAAAVLPLLFYSHNIQRVFYTLILITIQLFNNQKWIYIMIMPQSSSSYNN